MNLQKILMISYYLDHSIEIGIANFDLITTAWGRHETQWLGGVYVIGGHYLHIIVEERWEHSQVTAGTHGYGD